MNPSQTPSYTTDLSAISLQTSEINTEDCKEIQMCQQSACTDPHDIEPRKTSERATWQNLDGVQHLAVKREGGEAWGVVKDEGVVSGSNCDTRRVWVQHTKHPEQPSRKFSGEAQNTLKKLYTQEVNRVE